MLFRSWNGLVTYYTLFVIELRSRAVHVCGTTVSPNAQWMSQVARQLVDSAQGFALGKTHLIVDRDTKYVDDFRHTLEKNSAEYSTTIIEQPHEPQFLNVSRIFW